jgi:hypothetical protein
MVAVGNARMALAISRMPLEGNGRDARSTKMADSASMRHPGEVRWRKGRARIETARFRSARKKKKGRED